jgi:3',5'-cyclic AMP phosphodiesterase CpdA
MKIIQITDTHLMPRGTTLHKLNPCERLDSCIDNIIEHHSDAEFCVITGDLTDRGDIKANIERNIFFKAYQRAVSKTKSNNNKIR